MRSMPFVLRDASYDAPQDERKDAFTPELGEGFSVIGQLLRSFNEVLI